MEVAMDWGRTKPRGSTNQSRAQINRSHRGQTTSRRLPSWRQGLVALAIGSSIGIGSIWASTIWPMRLGCTIKGNISIGGERIYHVETGMFYDVTRIDPFKGERWFCSETEARAAGWRKSLR